MDIKTAIEKLDELERTMYALGYAGAMISLDAQTVAPSGSGEGRGVALGILAGEGHKRFASAETGELLAFLRSNAAELDAETARRVELEWRGYEQITRIPLEEYMEYSTLINESEELWHRAKEQSDFELFRPALEKVVAFQRKFAGYYDPAKKPYDALLNEYERGMDMEVLDRYFAELREKIVPLLAATQQAPAIDDSFLFRNYPIEKQREFNEYLLEVMGIDRSICGMAETEHPFTLNTDNRNVRVTTHYYADALGYAMYSTIHEGGHAIYEMNTDDRFRFTSLAGGASMGLHESQSRFYENIIGRSKQFVDIIFPKLKETFPEQLADVDAEKFFRAVNKAQPSLIRTEADELTYSLHVMVRYEIEKQIIGGTLEVKDIPAEWNRLYKEYLGIDVPSDKEGCLQDSHWSGGAFGYFPSYSLGSAYAAQMLAKMNEDFNLFAQLQNGNLSDITAWLKEKVHSVGCLYEPSEIVERACGAAFDPGYYTDYLTKKFSALYDL